MGRYGTLDYPVLAKRGFLLGLALFAVGVVGELLVHTVLTGLPGWIGTVLFDMELLGVVIGLLAPLVFGVVMPLTE